MFEKRHHKPTHPQDFLREENPLWISPEKRTISFCLLFGPMKWRFYKTLSQLIRLPGFFSPEPLVEIFFFFTSSSGVIILKKWLNQKRYELAIVLGLAGLKWEENKVFRVLWKIELQNFFDFLHDITATRFLSQKRPK